MIRTNDWLNKVQFFFKSAKYFAVLEKSAFCFTQVVGTDQLNRTFHITMIECTKGVSDLY